jgi:hypothetical protein
MDKPEKQAALRQDNENEEIRNTCIIGKRHRMDKPETQALLRQDT